MKSRSILAAIVLAFLFLQTTVAQEEEKTEDFVIVDHSKDDFKSLLGNKGANGGYLSIDITGGAMDGNQVFEAGGRLGWIINHSFAFGLAGYGFAQNIVEDPATSVTQLDLAGGYGGLLIEPIIWSKEIVHLSVPMVIGIGGAGKNLSSSRYDYTTQTYYENGNIGENDLFFMLRPGLEVEVNLSRFFRIALGGYYHQALGFQLEDVSSRALNGFTGGVSFKFGWF
ncbi:hypothetical protein ACE01N_17825 [Saccharicrinis sp. FJH2]|uniref:hypothetical protein n=1 Tax=Saccharicrinis sp. FJH65 TaxID=3344659 RepID=UPI0035F3E0D0